MKNNRSRLTDPSTLKAVSVEEEIENMKKKRDQIISKIGEAKYNELLKKLEVFKEEKDHKKANETEALIQSKMNKYLNPELSLKNGWIDQQGQFYGCLHCEHERINDELRSQVLESDYTHYFQRWIKITTVGSSVYIFLNQCFQKTKIQKNYLSAKQKIGIQKFIETHEVLKNDGQSITFWGYGEIYRDGNNIKFKKLD